jgi:cytochrome c oxidase subunit IV
MTNEQLVSPKTYLLVFGALLGFLLITVAVAFINLGLLNIVVALAIATAKALLIALYFMHLRYSDRLMWVVAAGGAFWLGILLTLTMSDYLTRGWIPITGK